MEAIKKKLGIWMDHSNANLIEFSSEAEATKTINSDFSNEDKVETLKRSEKEMQHKEHQKLTTYYKKLAAAIETFDEVLLFGPTDAKAELFNFLKEHPKYDKIKIEVQNTDKLSDEDKHTLVREYFKRFDIKKTS